jgi:hypothetical protein
MYPLSPLTSAVWKVTFSARVLPARSPRRCSADRSSARRRAAGKAILAVHTTFDGPWDLPAPDVRAVVAHDHGRASLRRRLSSRRRRTSRPPASPSVSPGSSSSGCRSASRAASSAAARAPASIGPGLDAPAYEKDPPLIRWTPSGCARPTPADQPRAARRARFGACAASSGSDPSDCMNVRNIRRAGTTDAVLALQTAGPLLTGIKRAGIPRGF